MLAKDDAGALEELVAKFKHESRQQPKTVLRINAAVYGIPDAGQAFDMLMFGLHIKHCDVYRRASVQGGCVLLDFLFFVFSEAIDVLLSIRELETYDYCPLLDYD